MSGQMSQPGTMLRRQIDMRRFACAAMMAVLLVACTEDGPPPVADTQPHPDADTCTTEIRTVGRWRHFTPPTDRNGGRTILPIVFLDGTTAQLVYPAGLGLGRLGVTSQSTSGVVDGYPSSQRGVGINYGRPPAYMLKGDAPLHCYEGAHGQVEVWETGERSVPQYMHIPLHSWTALIFDGNVGNYLSAREREAWATRLAAKQRSDGWIVLELRDGLKVGPQHQGDVQITLGNIGDRGILLWPVRCKPDDPTPQDVEVERGEVGGGQEFASWCDNGLVIHVYADGKFIEDVARDLEVRNVDRVLPANRYQIVP